MSILGFGGRAATNQTDARANHLPQGASTGQYGGLFDQTEELRDERINQDLTQAFKMKSNQQYEASLEIYLRVLKQHVHMKQIARTNVGEIYEYIGNYKLSKHHYTEALKIKENDSWVWNKVGTIEYEHYGNLEVAQKCFEAAINTRPTLQKRSAAICPILVKLAEISFKLCDYTKSEELVDSIIARSNSPNIDAFSKLFALKMKAFFHSMKGEDERKSNILKMLAELTGQERCSYDDLDIIKDFFSQIENSFSRFGSKGVALYDKNKKIYNFIKLQGAKNIEAYDKLNKFHILKLLAVQQENDEFSLQSLFDDFLGSLAQELDTLKESNESQNQIWNKTKINSDTFVQECQQAIQSFTARGTNELAFKQKQMTSEQLRELELQQEIDMQEQVKNTGAGAALANKAAKGKGGKQGANVVVGQNDDSKHGPNASAQTSTRRGLRRKMDFTEKQLSQISLKTLDSYKDYIVNEYRSSLSKKQQSDQTIDSNSMMEFIYSEKELIQSKLLIENKQLFKIAQSQSDFLANQSQGKQRADNNRKDTEQQNCSQAEVERVLDQADLYDVLKLFQSINGKRIHSALRLVLKFAFDYNPKLTNSVNSVALYKIFQFLMIAEGPFAQKWIQKQKEPWEFYCGSNKSNMLTLSGNSMKILVSLFELSLFNKFVLKAVKSGPIMEQRQVMFEFLNINETYLHQLIEEQFKQKGKHEEHNSKASIMEIDKNDEKETQNDESLKLRIRLIYAMMYCAFEIKNDMMHSVNLYQQLQSFIPFLKQNQVSIYQPWIYHDYFLDNLRMAEFGDFKIKQAKVFKDYDSGLLKLKQREHQLIEESKKAKGNLSQTHQSKAKQAREKIEQPELKNLTPIEEHEFDKYANFYLDQFFLYLNSSVTITAQLGSSSLSQDASAIEKQPAANSCTQMQNEEKVKEMWSQLTYSLCRASTPLLFKATQNLFCVFTTISFLNKSFHEQFILKKLDFEKIISSISNRLLATYNEIVNELKCNSDQYFSLYQLKEFTIERIFTLFGLKKHNLIQDTNLAEATIQRLLITLLRQITPEFLHYNIFLTQASNTAFQNMINQTGLQNATQAHHGGSQNMGSGGSNQAQPNMTIIQGLGQQVMQAGLLVNIFPQIFYHLEFFKSVINAEPQKDNAYNLRTVTRLLIHIDKLPYQNPEKKEIFVRAYSTLVVHAFPILIKCLKIDINRNQIQSGDANSRNGQNLQDLRDGSWQAGFAPIQISSTNNLLLFVSQVFKFFFDMKLSLNQIEEQSPSPSNILRGPNDIKAADQEDEDMINDDEDNYSDEDEEDLHFRRQAHLSCLVCQLKREKQSKSWTQMQSGTTSQSKTPMLKFFLNNCCLDISLLSDIISIVCFLTQDRPLKHGQMTLKDIKTIQTFNDVLIEYFMNNQTSIQENITSSPGNQLIKKFKEANKQTIFTQNFAAKDYQIFQQVNITENKAIKLMLEYLQNLIGHTILQQAPFQISRFDQAIRIGSSPQSSSSISQGQGILGNSATSYNFYFAYTKKGGALGNFPVQIAKIHETILNQISGNDQNVQKGQKIENLNQGSFQQFKSLSNSALRNLSRMIKLNLLQYPLLCSRSVLSSENHNPQSIEWLQNIRLFESIFNVSYLQSLIHFQQFVTDSGSALFISSKDIQMQPKTGLEEKTEKDRRRYLNSSIYSSILALRYIVERQKTYGSAELIQVFLEDASKNHFMFGDMNFFELCKMVLDQMLTIVVAKLKMIKLKNRLLEMADLGSKNTQRTKFEKKILNLKTVAYLLASIADQIDVFAAPSNDPRINNKLKKNSAQNIVLEILEKFLKQLEEQIALDFASAQKYFLETEKAEECLQKISEIGEQNHFESRQMDQRLNLNFLYSYIKAKYADSLNQKFKLSLYQNTFMCLRRSIEIAQANKNINGLLEAFKKLIKISLKLAIGLKYQKASLAPQAVSDYKNIIQNIVKPILQDSDLKKYIFKDLGQSLLSGLRDSDIQDEQVQQLSQYMNQGADNGVNSAQLNSSSIEESVIIQDTNSSKVRASIIKKEQMSGEDLLSGDLSLMREENDLNQIYKIADFVNNNLSNHTKQWFKAKYQLMCTQSLLSEIRIQDQIDNHQTIANDHGATTNMSSRISREKVKLLADMLKPINQTILAYEDTWNGMIYDESDKKNIITSMNHQELLGLTQLRIKYIKFFIDLCMQAHDYEPIKDIFKKKLHQFKQFEAVLTTNGTQLLQPNSTLVENSLEHRNSVISNGTMLFELKIVFDLSKDMYVSVLCQFIGDQLSKYKQVRKSVQQSQEKTKRNAEADNKWKTYSVKQAKEIFEAMRKELQVTKDNVPVQLKEVFDIFVEIHSKKGFLVTRKLISSAQKNMIIQAVLSCCAMCGPDNFNPNGSTPAESDKGGKGKAGESTKGGNKAHVKFLDLAKLQDPEYQMEGLMVCIQWYLEVLDKQSMKKNQDFHRKLKSVMEEFKQRLVNAGSSSIMAIDTIPAQPLPQAVKVQAQALGNSLSTAMQID